MKLISKTASTAAIAVLALSGTTWAAMEGKSSQQQTSSRHQTTRPEAVREQTTSLTAGERNFLQSAAEINATEVQLGKAALQKSKDPQVRQIAQHLVSDHTQANNELEKLASDKGIKITAQPNFREQRRISRLEKTSGEQFDKAFLRQNAISHERAISLFEAVSRRAQDPDIKQWSEKMLPGLKEHLASVRKLAPEAVAERRHGWHQRKSEMQREHQMQPQSQQQQQPQSQQQQQPQSTSPSTY